MMHTPLFQTAIYASRRKQLAAQVGKGLILLLGNNDSSMNYADNAYPFRQDSTFLYYVGLDLPGLAAIVDADTGNEVLLGNTPGIDEIIWTGPLPSLAELASLTGISATRPYAQLEGILRAAKSKGQAIHFLPPYRPENKIKLAGWLQLHIDALQEAASLTLIKAVVAQRQVKSKEEIKEINEAVSISADMHRAAMQYAQPGRMEYEVAAQAEAVALAANGRLAYPIICTVNGQTLHNHYHGNRLAEGQMILLDAGAENKMHYAGDLTRTFPAGKTFTARQKEIYEVVLNALNHAVQLLRPGILFKEVHTQACIRLMEGLKEVGLVKGDAAAAVAAGAHTLFFQCGLGHMMGLDVHDMEDLGEQYVGYSDTVKKSTAFGWKSLRLGKELQAGFVLTVEPGIYFIPALMDQWQAEQKLAEFINYKVVESYRDFTGIRIEDNFVITGNGSSKLGKHLVKTAAEIEAARQVFIDES